MNSLVKKQSLTGCLGLKRMACCGAKCGILVNDEEEEAPPAAVDSRMNLAAALAVGGSESEGSSPCPASPISGTGQPSTMSLMRLLEETDQEFDEDEDEYEEENRVCDLARCCVCMRREKGAAFIPCGHTFCTVCSRELRRSRLSCPLCNCRIIDILEIY